MNEEDIEDKNNMLDLRIQRSDKIQPNIEDSQINDISYKSSQKTLGSGIIYGISLGLIKTLFMTSSISSFEIQYFTCAIVTLTLFASLFYRGIYILDVEPNLRTTVIIRGFLTLIGMVLTYESINSLSSISQVLVIQLSSECICQFFLLKQERQSFTHVLAMSFSLISLVMVFIQAITPLQSDSKTISMDNMKGIGAAFISGVILAIISTLNQQTSKLKNEVLQQFYASCICACFSPLFILRGIGQTANRTEYGKAEIQILVAVSLIALLKAIWRDRKQSAMKVNVDFQWVMIPVTIIIDIYMSSIPNEITKILVTVGTAIFTSCALMLMNQQKIQLSY